MRTVLIVDDNCIELNAMSKLKIWNELGFTQVFCAQNGKIGYETAVKENPDIILTDVSMPIMDGIEMAKNIVKAKVASKFIFVSSFDESQYIREAIELEAFGYILKPINVDKLKSIVKNVMKKEDIINESNNKIITLEEQIKEFMPMVTQQAAKDLLYGSLNYEKTKLSILNMDVRHFVSVGVIQVNADFETQASQMYLYVSSVMDVLSKSEITHTNRIFAFIHSHEDIAFMFFEDKSENADDAENLLIESFEKLKSVVKEKTGWDISVFIGGTTEKIEDIPKCFQRALLVQGNFICSKQGGVFLTDTIVDYDEMIQYDINELKKKITDVVENDTEDDEISKFVDIYCPEKMIVNENFVRNMLFNIITALNIVLFEKDESFEHIFGNEYMIWNKIFDAKSIQNVRMFISNILMFTKQYFDNKKQDRYEVLIEKIKDIVNTQYAQIENINEISSQVFLSTVHANSLFLKFTGETIFDYLTKVRIEKAKLLLKDRQYKIYEIVEMVGYTSKQYFANLFRNYTGMTPSEYRSKNSV